MKTLKQYILENEDHNHPKNWKVEKMHRDDTFNGKTRWDIKDKSGEIIDSHETSADAHHYLKNWRKRYTDRILPKNTVKESLIMDKPIHTKTISADELMKHIGRSKIKSIAKHPFHREYVSGSHLGNTGYQYHRDSHGYEHVLASHTEPLKGKDGTERRRMIKFDLFKNHVDNAHLFHNKNNERHHPDDGGNRIWRHIKSHKEENVS